MNNDNNYGIIQMVIYMNNNFYFEKLISKIKEIEAQYKKTGIYEFENTNLKWNIPFRVFIILIIIMISIISLLWILELGELMKIIIYVIISLIIIFISVYLVVNFVLKIISKIVLKKIKLEKNYVTFQYSDKIEKYDINKVSIKHRSRIVATGKGLVRSFHIMIIGDDFEKWILAMGLLEYHALIYFIYFLKIDELEKIDTINNEFLSC